MAEKIKVELNKMQAQWLLDNGIEWTQNKHGWHFFRKGLRCVTDFPIKSYLYGSWNYSERRGPTTWSTGSYGTDLKSAMRWMRDADLEAQPAAYDTFG